MSSRNPKYIQKYKWTIVGLYYLGKHIKKYARNMEFLPIKLSYTQVVSESVSSFCSQLNVIHIVFNFFKLCDFLHRWNIFVFVRIPKRNRIAVFHLFTEFVGNLIFVCFFIKRFCRFSGKIAYTIVI